MAPNTISICIFKLHPTKNLTPNEEKCLIDAQEAIYDVDERKPVYPKDIQPGGIYRGKDIYITSVVTQELTIDQAIVKLFIRFENQDKKDGRWFSATGWTIRDNIVVTAAHCIYNQSLGLGRAVEIKV